jgi:hypothetical protein
VIPKHNAKETTQARNTWPKFRNFMSILHPAAIMRAGRCAAAKLSGDWFPFEL